MDQNIIRTQLGPVVRSYDEDGNLCAAWILPIEGTVCGNCIVVPVCDEVCHLRYEEEWGDKDRMLSELTSVLENGKQKYIGLSPGLLDALAEVKSKGALTKESKDFLKNNISYMKEFKDALKDLNLICFSEKEKRNMGPSLFYSNCPGCGKPGISKYRSWRNKVYEVFSCSNCGLGFDRDFRRNKKKSTPENPVYTENTKTKKGRFKVCVMYKNGDMEMFSFLKGVSEEDAMKMYKDIFFNPKVDRQRSYLTKWDDQTQRILYFCDQSNPILN